MSESYPAYDSPLIPRAFIWRRVHSLMGLWLVLFLLEHLLTNSQAALFIGDDGSGFVSAVNTLKDLPYLPVIEIVFLAIPFLIHGIWGVQYLFSGKWNSFPTEGSSPALPQYSRNQAYTWQRITSWILLVGVIAHVIHMRFMEYPTYAQLGTQQMYMNRVESDTGLVTLSKRLGFEILDRQQVEDLKATLRSQPPVVENLDSPESRIAAQTYREQIGRLEAIEKWPLKDNQVMLISPTFGVAELMMVRDSFKSPTMILLYTLFVLAACFHAFNGLWTGMIKWGITLTARSQKIMRRISIGLMLLVTSLGLAAIWGTYWFNLTQ